MINDNENEAENIKSRSQRYDINWPRPTRGRDMGKNILNIKCVLVKLSL